MYNILVVYYYTIPQPPRVSVVDHLYCFRRYGRHRVFYLNAAVWGIPRLLRLIPFDLIVFHTTFLGARWNRPAFAWMMKRMAPLKKSGAVKVALPQDEFINTDLLCRFINEFAMEHVFSVAPESEWNTIYDEVDRERTAFHQVLTGYLDDATLKRINQLAESGTRRRLDIGYRAWHAAPWLGRHGKLKTDIAARFEDRAPLARINADISTRAEDTLYGDDWYRFLLDCKYTIGVEGGASILDRDGEIRQRTEAYLARHPKAAFDAVEAACFPRSDGSLRLFSISPRHLEACATRTCQILIEGGYNGVLEPGKHYVPLKRDFSNLPQVLETIQRDDVRERIASQAYEDVVASGRYTYPSFVRLIVETALANRPARKNTRIGSAAVSIAALLNRMRDKIAWTALRLFAATLGRGDRFRHSRILRRLLRRPAAT